MKILITLIISSFIVSNAMAIVQNPVSNSWSLCNANKQRQGWSTNGTPLTSVAIKWTNTTVNAAAMLWGGTPKLGSAVTDNERLYISVGSVAENNDANLLALDLATGNNLWDQKISSVYAIGTPAVTEDRVYAGEINDAAYGMIACVEKATGNIIWTNPVDQILGGSILVHDDKVIFGSKWSDGGLHCLDAHGGTSLWNNTSANTGTDGAAFWTDTGAAVSPDGSRVYFRTSTASGKLVAADAISGTTAWSVTFATVVNSEGCQPVVDSAGNIYSGFDGINTTADPDIVVKFLPDGSTNWIYSFSGDVWGNRGSFALSPDNSTLYCCNPITGITALNTADGSLKWDANCGVGRGGCVVAAPGNIIISVFGVGSVATAKGIQDEGSAASTLWSVPLSPQAGWLEASGSTPTLLNNGDVIVETADGMIACITYSSVVSPTNKLILSASPWYGGTVEVSPPGEWFLTNEVVTITSAANVGYAFTNWSGDASGSASPIILTMSVPRSVQANYTPVNIAVPDSNVWETFDSPQWGDNTWYAQGPDSLIRRLSYTNFDNRSCLAYHLVNCGSNAQLHTDFGLFPYVWTNNPNINLDMWAPNLGDPYTIRVELKSDLDITAAGTTVVVNAEGWVTINTLIEYPEEPISIYWLAIGGFPGDLNLPAGQTTTFFIDKLYATGSGGDAMIDDFNVNPTWPGSENWQKRPRNWRYDMNSDYTAFPFDETRNYHPLGIDPTGVHTGMCLVLPFDDITSTSKYAKVENDDLLYADMSLAAVIEADVRVTASNTPIGFTFYDSTAGTGNVTEVTAYQTVQPGGWQHLSWSLPPHNGSFHWGNVEKLGIMVRTEAGDAGNGTLYLDNISFIIPEPVLTVLFLLFACVWRKLN